MIVLAWDDLDSATMDLFGGPVETPTCPGWWIGVSSSRTSTRRHCAPPSSASLLTGRNATTNGMGHHRRVQLGVSRHLDTDPIQLGFISEVLAEHGCNTYCVGSDSASPVTPDNGVLSTFSFSRGRIDNVVDVSGERYTDHEAAVRTWFGID